MERISMFQHLELALEDVYTLQYMVVSGFNGAMVVLLFMMLVFPIVGPFLPKDKNKKDDVEPLLVLGLLIVGGVSYIAIITPAGLDSLAEMRKERWFIDAQLVFFNIFGCLFVALAVYCFFKNRSSSLGEKKPENN